MKPDTGFPPPIELVVLAVVARRPMHGYAIIEQLRSTSGGHFDLPEGSVYPALYRLERLGLLASDAHQVGGRTRRTYRATAAGRGALRSRRGDWDRLVASVTAVLAERPAPDHA